MLGGYSFLLYANIFKEREYSFNSMKKEVVVLVVVLMFTSVLTFSLISEFVSADGTCSGTPHACASHNGDQSACTSAGCNYNANNNKCTASHNACSSYSSQTTCQAHSCTWTETPLPEPEPTPTTTEPTATTTETGAPRPPVKIVVRSPLDGDTLRRGSFDLVVEGFEGTRPSSGIRVSASSPLFGDMALVENFRNQGVGVYGGVFTIGTDVPPGTYEIIVRGELSTYDEQRILITVDPLLRIETALKEEYQKGERLVLDGRVSYFDSEAAAGIPLIITLQAADFRFTKVMNTSSLGRFSFEFPITFAEPEGRWEVRFHAADAVGNEGEYQATMEVSTPSGIAYHQIIFLSPVQHTEFARGEIVPISVEVREEGNLVPNLEVTFRNVQGERIALEEVTSGTYSGEYKLGLDNPLGPWPLAVESIQKKENKTYKAGGNRLALSIRPAAISAALIKPDRTDFFTGQAIEFELHAEYTDGTPLTHGNVLIQLGEKNIKLEEQSPGKYTTRYILALDDAQVAQITAKVEDLYGNTGEVSPTPIIIEKVEGYELQLRLFYYNVFLRYWYLFVGGLLVFMIITYPLWHRLHLHFSLKRTLQNEVRVIEIQKDLQRKYFKHHSISRNDYEKLMLEHREKMSTLKEKKLELQEKLGKRKR